jgi:hypothetical protein
MTDLSVHKMAVLFIVLVLASSVASSVISVRPPVIPRDATFSDAQKNAITVLIEMNKLVISIALLVIGAVAAVIFKLRDQVGPFRRGDRVLLVLALVGSGLSFYFGFDLYFRMVEMLAHGGFVADAAILLCAQKLQYYTLLGAVVTLALVVVRRLD